jgi:hypothetical protein
MGHRTGARIYTGFVSFCQIKKEPERPSGYIYVRFEVHLFCKFCAANPRGNIGEVSSVLCSFRWRIEEEGDRERRGENIGGY